MSKMLKGIMTSIMIALMLLGGGFIPQGSNNNAVYAAPADQAGSRTFPETGNTVKGRFLEVWNAMGGLPLQGYPITGEIQENGLTVQYFERNRFEYHPENAQPFDVLLGLLGVQAYNCRYPNGAPGEYENKNGSGTLYSNMTRHWIGGAFAVAYQTRGLMAIGYPVSGEFQENGLTVQYFERVRAEYHPENRGTPYEVLYGLLGVDAHNGTLCNTGNSNPGHGNNPSNGGTVPTTGKGGDKCPAGQNVGVNFNLNANPDLGNDQEVVSRKVEDCPLGGWCHRLFNTDLFNQENGWGGADSWYNTISVLSQNHGRFMTHNKTASGEFRFRMDNTNPQASMALAVHNQRSWNGIDLLNQFLDGKPAPAQLSIKTAPYTPVYLINQSGTALVCQTTSDQGDITITLPENGNTAVYLKYRVGAPSDEDEWNFGSYDRGPGVDNTPINVLRGENYQWK